MFFPPTHLDNDLVPFFKLPLQHLDSQRILDALLDRPLQRTRAEVGIEALVGQIPPGALVHLNVYLPVRQAFLEIPNLDIYDGRDLVPSQRVEGDDLVHPVQELGPESCPESLINHLPALLRIPGAHFMEPLGADIGGHDQDRVPEIDGTALPVGQAPIVQHLKKDIEHVGVGFLDLIQQNHAVGTAPDGFGELPSLLVAHVPRRSPDEPRYGVLFHVLRHIEADHGHLIIKEELGQCPGQLRLAHPRRPQEDEGPGRPVGVVQTGA